MQQPTLALDRIVPTRRHAWRGAAPLLCAAALAVMMGTTTGCASSNGRPKSPSSQMTGESLEVRRERAARLAAQAAVAEQSDPERALQLYRESIAAYPDFAAAWHNLGEFLYSRGELMPAAEALQTASRLSPTEPRSPYLLGKLYYDRRFFDIARTNFDVAIRRDPNYLPAIRGIVAVASADRSADSTTLALIDRALLLERDPQWLNFFENERLRIQSDLERRSRDQRAG
jgi:tetratricopeptide (TPR) repeat protein